MTFKFNHFNFNVTDLERSKAFYREALGLEESHRIEADDGSYVIVYREFKVRIGTHLAERPSAAVRFGRM